MLGLYLHIPFCQAICSYCNFNRGLYDGVLKGRYVDALEREILDAAAAQTADTIFFGGGTPSLLDPEEVARLIDACRRAFDLAPGAEITLETNPETAEVGRLRAFRAAGVNRLSFGAQSFDNEELARLGRVHDAARVVASIEDARRAGFDNVSLDLMFWLPGQSRASWRRSIERAIALAPDHLSLYMLELYPNAPLRDAMARAAQTAPTNSASARAWAQAADDEAADMYLDALERLDAAGFVQYEISNVTRLGHESRHNLKYWTGGSWRGFGCGAHSTVDGERWHNLASTIHYVERIDAGEPVDIDRERLSRQARIEEALFTGLRLSSGIDRRQFETQYGIDPWTMYSERLQDAVRAGAIWRTADRFGLTRQGMLIANEVLTAFV